MTRKGEIIVRDMGFAWLSMWKNIVNFQGETCRKDFWLALLTNGLVNGLLIYIAWYSGVKWLLTVTVIAQLAGVLAFLSMYIRQSCVRRFE